MLSNGETMKMFIATAALFGCLCGYANKVNSTEINAALGQYVNRGEIAGIVSVLSDPDYNETWNCLGWSDAENRVPMTSNTVFAIFSMTKTFTGCAIMIAVDRGILKMDSRVEQFLPEFQKLENKVTIRDCMCHVSGIYGGDVSMIHTSVPLREQARLWALNGKCLKKNRRRIPLREHFHRHGGSLP